MKAEITYEPTGQTVSLSGGVDAETFAWLESLQGQCHRVNPIITCGTCHGSLFLRHDPRSRDRLHGVHHVSAGCRELVITRAVMTDEHKNEAEYHARGGAAAGLPADMEVVTTGRTKVDVVVGNVGFEVQHSGASLGAVRGRTHRSMAAGLDVVTWFADQSPLPTWYEKVPSHTARMRSWREMPPPRTVTVIGPQKTEAVRCEFGNLRRFPAGLCPDGSPRPCGKYHVGYEPWAMLLDDFVVRLAIGEILAARTGKFVRLMPPSSLRLYEDLTGESPSYDPGRPLAHRATPDERIECTRPVASGWASEPRTSTQAGAVHFQAQGLLPLHLPDARQPVGSGQTDAALTRSAGRKKPGTPCTFCGYPMAEGTCNRQACKVTRHYRAEGGDV